MQNHVLNQHRTFATCEWNTKQKTRQTREGKFRGYGIQIVNMTKEGNNSKLRNRTTSPTYQNYPNNSQWQYMQ